MLLTSKEVEALKHLYTTGRHLSEPYIAENAIYDFFSTLPHLLVIGGKFDEYVDDTTDRESGCMTFRRPNGAWFELDTIECGQAGGRVDYYETGELGGEPVDVEGELEFWELEDDEDDDEVFETIRREPFWEPETNGMLFFCKKGANDGAPPALELSFEEVLNNIERFIQHPDDSERRLWTPQLWTPTAQARERKAIRSTASRLLAALSENRITFDDVHWSQVEDIVAELLIRSGMEIHKIVERPQGGRDIIARGELIPGEERGYLAVEVKHKQIVERPEVQAALWQNRHFPALMFVTTGRFSAGVFQEKRMPENRLRLVLKDGEALSSMITNHFTARPRRRR